MTDEYESQHPVMPEATRKRLLSSYEYYPSAEQYIKRMRGRRNYELVGRTGEYHQVHLDAQPKSERCTCPDRHKPCAHIIVAAFFEARHGRG